MKKIWCVLFHHRYWLEEPLEFISGRAEWFVDCIKCDRRWKRGLENRKSFNRAF